MGSRDLNFIVCRRFNQEIHYYCYFRLDCLAQMGRHFLHYLAPNREGVGLAFIFIESLHLNNLDILYQRLSSHL